MSREGDEDKPFAPSPVYSRRIGAAPSDPLINYRSSRTNDGSSGGEDCDQDGDRVFQPALGGLQGPTTLADHEQTTDDDRDSAAAVGDRVMPPDPRLFSVSRVAMFSSDSPLTSKSAEGPLFAAPHSVQRPLSFESPATPLPLAPSRRGPGASTARPSLRKDSPGKASAKTGEGKTFHSARTPSPGLRINLAMELRLRASEQKLVTPAPPEPQHVRRHHVEKRDRLLQEAEARAAKEKAAADAAKAKKAAEQPLPSSSSAAVAARRQGSAHRLYRQEILCHRPSPLSLSGAQKDESGNKKPGCTTTPSDTASRHHALSGQVPAKKSQGGVSKASAAAIALLCRDEWQARLAIKRDCALGWGAAATAREMDLRGPIQALRRLRFDEHAARLRVEVEQHHNFLFILDAARPLKTAVAAMGVQPPALLIRETTPSRTRSRSASPSGGALASPEHLDQLRAASERAFAARMAAARHHQALIAHWDIHRRGGGGASPEQQQQDPTNGKKKSSIASITLPIPFPGLEENEAVTFHRKRGTVLRLIREELEANNYHIPVTSARLYFESLKSISVGAQKESFPGRGDSDFGAPDDSLMTMMPPAAGLRSGDMSL